MIIDEIIKSIKVSSIYFMRRPLFKTALVFLCIGISNSLFSQAGILDNTFGINGIVTNTISNKGKTLVIRPDGKIVTMSYSGWLMSFNSDGSVDNTFGNNGIVTGTNIPAVDMALQTDGKLVVASSVLSDNSVAVFGVGRYLSNGVPDPSFGINGRVTTTVAGSGHDDGVEYVIIQPDGKIIVAGETVSKLEMVRYNGDGTLDNTFGNNGIVISNSIGISNPGSPVCTGIKLQPDGKIIQLAWYFNTSTSYATAVFRYNTDGSLDNTFGLNGISTQTALIGSKFGLQSDGKIIIGGSVFPGSNIVLLRLNSNGGIDSSFGNNGLTTVVPNLRMNGIIVQPDDRVFVAAWISGAGTTGTIVLTRYNSDGSADQNFGNSGTTLTDINSGLDAPRGVAMQPDGKILITGQSDDNVNNINYFLLARYHSGLVIGLNENSNSNNKVFLCPNPTNGKLYFEAKEIDKIKITNYLGQTVYVLDNPNPKQEIDLSSFSDGIYFLTAQSKTQQKVFKIVKE